MQKDAKRYAMGKRSINKTKPSKQNFEDAKTHYQMPKIKTDF